MSAAKSTPKSRTAKASAKSTPSKAIPKAAGGAAASAGDRVGRGTRWTEDQVGLLMEAVKGSSTAKEAFESVARQLGKSTGTVQQKYYNLQKKAGGGTSRRGRRPAAGARSAPRAAAPSTSARGGGSGLPGVSDLRGLTVDELVGLATRVKAEVDRRRSELDAAAKLLSR